MRNAVAQALDGLRADPGGGLVRAVSCMWGVAVLVGLFSPVHGFKVETEELFARETEAAGGVELLLALNPGMADHLRWREEHAAKWDRGLTFVVSVCIGLGALGTMNVGLSQLKDRVREVAIRKSVGASDRDIRAQLLLEGLFTSTLGGLAGAALGLGLARVGTDLIGLPFAVSPRVVAGGVAAAVVAGLLAALWPAWRAARRSPVDALREL